MCRLSSFTLGVTEVAERLQVPWLSLSYADSITERGFKYTFQTSPVSSLQAEQALELVARVARGDHARYIVVDGEVRRGGARLARSTGKFFYQEHTAP